MKTLVLMGQQLAAHHPKQQIIKDQKQIHELSCLQGLKLISSPSCTVSGLIFMFVLNSLIRYTSVTAYMKSLSRPSTSRFVQECLMS